MDRREKDRLKAISFLLEFPDEPFRKDLEGCAEQLCACFEGEERKAVERLVEHLLDEPALALQETYCAAFDLNPGTCLNITYHTYGDDKARGEALARFAHAYEAAGFSIRRAELPDFLPMVLELMASDPGYPVSWMLHDHKKALSTIAGRLGETQSAYTGIFEILAGTPAEEEQV
jgi:nitrate reductase delta subunit